MIRRVTPNKDFRGRSKSNCCAWLCSDATSNKSELRFTVCETDGKQKTRKRGFSNAATAQFTARSTIAQAKPQLTLNLQQKLSNAYCSSTPRTNFKIFTYKTDQYKSNARATTPGTMSTEGHGELPESMMPSTPLERLKKRNLFKREARSPVRNERLFGSQVRQVEKVRQKQNSIGERQRSVSRMIKKQIMGMDQNLLVKIRRYKNEYEGLLQQYEVLSNQRQQNLKYYEQLLKKIYEKKNEVKQRQRKSLQKLKQVREDFQKVKAVHLS